MFVIGNDTHQNFGRVVREQHSLSCIQIATLSPKIVSTAHQILRVGDTL